MQEQKKYQIEKVNHSPITTYDNYQLLSYFPYNNVLATSNFIEEQSLRKCKTRHAVGFWRIKQQKLNH